MLRGNKRKDEAMSNHHLPLFEKARRNLMGVSIALTLIILAGIDFKTINILGNESQVDNPEMISWFIAGVWIYFICHFWVYRKRVITQEPYFVEYTISLDASLHKYLVSNLHLLDKENADALIARGYELL